MNTGCGRAKEQGGGFAAAHLLVRRAWYGAAPPASRLLRIADATALRAGLDPGDHYGPSGRKHGQARPAPLGARRTSNGPQPLKITIQDHYTGSLYGSRGLPRRRHGTLYRRPFPP
jgi:hypothetical protein